MRCFDCFVMCAIELLHKMVTVVCCITKLWPILKGYVKVQLMSCIHFLHSVSCCTHVCHFAMAGPLLNRTFCISNCYVYGKGSGHENELHIKHLSLHAGLILQSGIFKQQSGDPVIF